MKNTNKIITLLTSSVFVTVPLAQPESDIATPVEKTEFTQGVPDLEQAQKENWQRLREERKRARQQILSDIKANAQAEIKDIQQDLVKQKPNNAQNENKGIGKEKPIIKEKAPHEIEREKKEKLKHENTPFENPRPGELPIAPKGPKI
jgi:hypothetical protein